MNERGNRISPEDIDGQRLHSAERRHDSQTVRRNPTTNSLEDHPAVIGYRATGVNTDDLVSFIESFASLRASRVKKIGHDQYALATGQKFETFSAQETIKELLEELADAGNYIDFLAIKLLNLSSIMNESELDCG